MNDSQRELEEACKIHNVSLCMYSLLGRLFRYPEMKQGELIDGLDLIGDQVISASDVYDAINSLGSRKLIAIGKNNVVNLEKAGLEIYESISVKIHGLAFYDAYTDADYLPNGHVTLTSPTLSGLSSFEKSLIFTEDSQGNVLLRNEDPTILQKWEWRNLREFHDVYRKSLTFSRKDGI